MTNISSRIASFPNSAISYMARLAEQYNAINLAQGVPDFDPPPELIQAAIDALKAGHNQYAHTWGSPRFRQALARKHNHFTGLEIDPDLHITTTVGGTEALLATLAAITNPGDKVAIFSPHYEAYPVDTHLFGAEPVYIQLHLPDFMVDPDELRRVFQQGVKALVLCNPANPSGKVFNKAELEIIASLAQEFDVIVLADEIYEHIVYPPYQHTYLSSIPGMFERTVSCSSLSKTYAVTGWRVGYAIAPPHISEAIRKVHDFLTVGAPTPLQEAAVTALEFPSAYYEELQSEYQRKRDIIQSYLEAIGLPYIQPQGAYYILIDISAFGYKSDYDFCAWLVKNIGVAVLPGSYFFHEPVNHLVRINFAKRDETLHEAGRRFTSLK